MRYFSTLDDLFNFKYLLTEDDLSALSPEMLANGVDIEVTSNIGSELEIGAELRLRADRITGICRNIIAGILYKAEKVEEPIDLLKYINNCEYDTAIVGPNLATILIDDINFLSKKINDDDIPGTPFIIGKIGKVNIILDPILQYDDDRVIVYNKTELSVSAYIKDFKVISDSRFLPFGISICSIFHSNFNCKIFKSNKKVSLQYDALISKTDI